MASFLLRWLLALLCVLLAVTPAQAGVTVRHSELLERDATGRVVSASATAGPRGTAPDLWRGYRYSSLGRLDRVFKSLPLEPTNGVPLDTSSLAFLPVGSSGVADFAGDLGPSATGDSVLHTPGTGALESSAVQGFDEAVRGAGHRLLSVEVDGTAFELSYDSSGRVVTCEPTDPEVTAGYRLEWDVLSRLVAVYAGPGPGVLLERYVYDADGRLAGRFAADGSSETYVYSGEQMVEAYDTDGEVLWQALWGPGLDELVEFRNVARDGPGAPPLLALTDFRRSVVGFLTADEDDELAVEGFVEYGPWGRVESVADSPMGEGAGCVEAGQVGVQCALPGGSPFGFVGAWRSDRTGLVYMRHRWYDPRLGQFLSHDPLGAVDSANLYTYVAGDPINLWDPWGLEGGGFKNQGTVPRQNGYVKRPSGYGTTSSPRDPVHPYHLGGPGGHNGMAGVGKHDWGAHAFAGRMDGGQRSTGPRDAQGQYSYYVRRLVDCAFRVGASESGGCGFPGLSSTRERQAFEAALDQAQLNKQLRDALIEAAEPSLWSAVPGVGALLQAKKFDKARVLADKLAGAPSNGGGSPLYRIDDGVRRSKAADIVGNPTVPARIKRPGQPDELVDLPVDQLRSPKSNIPFDSRFRDNNVNPARQGSRPPPIEVTPIPGEHPGLVPIPNVTVGPP